MASLEPIDIDINLNQNVSSEGTRVTESTQQMSQSVDAMERKIQELNKQLEENNRQLAEQRKRTEEFAASSRDANSYIDKMQAMLANQNKELEAAQSLITELRQGIAEGANVTQVIEATNQGLNNVERNLGNIQRAGSSSNQSLKKQFEELGETIEFQRAIISKLEEDYRKAKQAFDKVNISTSNPQEQQAKAQAKQLLLQTLAELEDERKGLESLEKEYANLEKQLNKLNQTASTYASRMNKIREEMMALTQAGEQESERYRELQEELEETGSAYRQVMEEQRYLLGSGNATITGLLAGMSALSGAYSASSGVLALFISDNEDLVAIQTKLQAVMAITIGLQEVSTALHSQSAFRINVVSRVTNLFATAQTRLAVGLGISNVAAKALMATLTLGLSVAITGIIYLIDKLSTEQSKLYADIKKMNESTASSVNQVRTDYEKLRKEWVLAGNDLKKKNELLLKNADAYDKIGASITSAKEGDDIFINKAEDFKESILLRAKATAAIETAAEKYKESIQKMLDAEERVGNPTLWDKTRGALSWFGAQQAGIIDGLSWDEYSKQWAEKSSKENNAEAVTLKEEAEALIVKALGFDEKADNLGFDAKNKVEKGTKAYYQAVQKVKQKAIDALTEKELHSAKGRKLIAERDQAQLKVQQWGSTKDSSKVDSSLASKVFEYQKKIEDARLDAIHEGITKEREANKKRYEETLAYIEKEKVVLSSYEKKKNKPLTAERDKLTELAELSAIQFEEEEKRINEKAGQSIASIFSDITRRIGGEKENALAELDAYYNEALKKAKENEASIEGINRINDARKSEEKMMNISFQLKDLDFQEALSNESNYLLESAGLHYASELRKYETTKKFLEQRIRLLEALGTDEATKEAALLKAQLEGLQKPLTSISGTINNILFKKLEDGLKKSGLSAEDANEKTANIFKQITDGSAIALEGVDALQTMFGGLNEDLDTTLNLVGGIAQGFAQGGLAGGIFATVGAGLSIFSKSAQVEREHQQALKELALAKVQIQREYNLLLQKEQLLFKQGQNIFGTDQIQGAVNSINAYHDRLNDLKNELKGEPPRRRFFDALFNQGREYEEKLKAYNQGIGALANIDIVTGSKTTGALFWKKRKDVYTPLLEVYDDIIDKDGQLNTLRIESILNTHKMSDENRALLQSLLDLDKAAKDAQEQLKSYLSQTFGALGNDLSNSIVAAFKNGEDASLAFKDSVIGTLEEISKQMVFSLFLKDSFDKLEKDIENSYNDLANDKITEQQLAHNITDILGGFFSGIDSNIEEANKFLEEFWKNAESNGFERPESQREGTKKGFANASQDSINELIGGVYAVRQMVGDIRQTSKENVLIQKTFQSQITLLVQRSEYWVYLKRLESVEKILDSMSSHGVKIKSL